MILGWGHTLKALKSTVQGTVWDDKLHLHKLYQVNIQAIAEYDSGALAREARSGAPWVTKCGKLPIRENLVIT